MNKAGGFIVIHRQILDWEWYRDTNTFCLFIHLLLMANYEDGRFEGRIIKRGQLVTSLPSLSDETGLSIRQTRTALEHLISTGEVTNKSYTKYRVITITNYDRYQDKRQTKRQTNDRQPTDNLTDNRQQYNNITNINKGTNNNREGFTPPTLDEVKSFIQETNSPVDPERFFYHYDMSGWVLNGGQKMKNWKSAIKKWERTEGNAGNGNAGNRKGNAGETRTDYTDLFAAGGVVQV